MNKKLIQVRKRRAIRNRAKVRGSAAMPRLSIFRSNVNIYAQLIDDEKAVTIASATSLTLRGASTSDKAKAVGKAIAVLAKQKSIEAAVFDRGGYLYAGAIKALADGAREGGLKF